MTRATGWRDDMISDVILDTVSFEVDDRDDVQRAVAFSTQHFGLDGASDVDPNGFTIWLTQK